MLSAIILSGCENSQGEAHADEKNAQAAAEQKEEDALVERWGNSYEECRNTRHNDEAVCLDHFMQALPPGVLKLDLNVTGFFTNSYAIDVSIPSNDLYSIVTGYTFQISLYKKNANPNESQTVGIATWDFNKVIKPGETYSHDIEFGKTSKKTGEILVNSETMSEYDAYSSIVKLIGVADTRNEHGASPPRR